LFYQYEINTKMTIQPSLQVTWYMQGAEDAGNYATDSLNRNQSISYVYTNGSKEAFKPSAYLHLGYSYKITPSFTASAYAYNLLGIIDENLNKRQEFQRVSMYRVQPVSFSFRLEYQFK